MKILIRGPEEMKCALQKESKRMGISMNALVLVILGDWMEELKRKEKAG